MLKIAFCKIDVTPDKRGAIDFIPVKNPVPALDPLFARLFLVDADGTRTLAVSLDYCMMAGAVLEDWTHRLAAVLHIPDEQVMLHAIHLHDAPAIFVEAAERMQKGIDWSWLEVIIGKLETAARTLPDQLTEVGKLGWAETRLSGYASNRRVPMPDGSVAIRYSRCGDPAVRNRPAGLIDPMLRTLSFYDTAGKLLAAWSFYASHPQVANEGYRYGGDAQGESARQLEARFPGVLCGFFNGCMGNITAGKFSDPVDLPGNIKHFGTMLADGITRNLTAPEFFAPTQCAWEIKGFPFPARTFTAEELKQRGEWAPSVSACMAAAMEFVAGKPEIYTLRMLTLGDAKVIFLGGEPFIEYQLYLQGLVPNEKLAVVSNCGDGFFYLGTEEALRDPSGYETNSFCRVKPEFEALFRKTAQEMLLPEAK